MWGGTLKLVSCEHFGDYLSIGEKFFNKKRTVLNAFTLLETLLTLGIIGIVAAITLPVVINKIDEKITVHKLKKFYTTMDQAIKLNEHHNPDNYYTIIIY